ncbi:class I SAM-dependent methyltransferase [Imtechella halotolerans]|nr:class I SAM-dependent methyltransferase [Imtechella halotolerans]WMQ62916.1 class I SAM-dependent methyltransferase [Imtechella halotolerans]
MRLKDFSVSKEVFELHYNKQYDMLETQPKPASSVLPKYYASEDYISHTDGKRTFFEKIYQFVRSIALSSKASLVASHANGKTVLDIGAGTGDFLSRMNTLGWYSEGYEPNGKATTIAISKGVKVHSDMELIENEYFEVITMWHVLEHVSNLNDQLNFINRRLTETGVIIVAVPNFKSFDAKFYKKYWAGYDVPRHLWHFSQKSIELLFAEKGFKVVCTKPMWFDAFYVSMLSEKYKGRKFSFLRGLCIGFLSNLSACLSGEFSSLIYVLKRSKSDF